MDFISELFERNRDPYYKIYMYIIFWVRWRKKVCVIITNSRIKEDIYLTYIYQKTLFLGTRDSEKNISFKSRVLVFLSEKEW